MKILTLTLSLILFHFIAYAQATYSIQGVVKDGSGETLPSATIFLDGSEKKTLTNDKGEYLLSGLSPGTYQLTVHYVGYKTFKQHVQIEDQSVTVNAKMESTEIALKEVVITNNSVRSKYMHLFIRNFLGLTDNGMSCEIMNPKILRFSEQGMYVTATTRDFLVIENRNLGYRIKYLLRDFRINRASQIASYTGECIFENMKGTDDQQKEWVLNRLNAYKGSMMHYLRSLHANTSQAEGFYSFPIKGLNKETQEVATKYLQNSDFTAPDKSFLTIQFSDPMYVLFDKEGAPDNDDALNEQRINQSVQNKSGSIMELHLKKAVVDSRGSLVDYRSFLVKGFWGVKRLGDQLPFEYRPD